MPRWMNESEVVLGRCVQVRTNRVGGRIIATVPLGCSIDDTEILLENGIRPI